MKIALLSNVNMNFVIRMLQKEVQVYDAEGYGNELGTLMNPNSSYHTFAPDVTFLIMDVLEVIAHDLQMEAAKEKMASWFAALAGCLKENQIYYISDAYLWGMELQTLGNPALKTALEGLWQQQLQTLVQEHVNVRVFPYHQIVSQLGEKNAFSLKMWYMGRILLSTEAQQLLCDSILHKVQIEQRTAKKVLVLDLDNTLWGGLAGEAEHTPIILSEEHGGLAYKNLQRVILQMQKQGVLLAIVSKNNEEDALSILEGHSHMVLRPECFAARRINWQPKHENILEIAKELNLGTDSFVFWDDNPTERQLIREMLPEVTVPEFPDRCEDLAPAMVEIYKTYFEKGTLTKEDMEKTAQYAANAKRNQLSRAVGSFEEYLKQLQIVVTKVEPQEHIERLTQLVNKTNQFNLTTKRYTQSQMQDILTDDRKRVFLYQVTDRFGDNGVVAAAIVDVATEVPIVEELVMSCRVMGKNIEYAIMDDIEKVLKEAGYETLQGIYLPSAKNKPVEGLYEQLGYRKSGELPEGGMMYRLSLKKIPKRVYFATVQ